MPPNSLWGQGEGKGRYAQQLYSLPPHPISRVKSFSSIYSASLLLQLVSFERFVLLQISWSTVSFVDSGSWGRGMSICSSNALKLPYLKQLNKLIKWLTIGTLSSTNTTAMLLSCWLDATTRIYKHKYMHL